MAFKSLTCGDVDLEALESLSGPQLATLYRELTGKEIQKFRDKKTGLDRVRPLLSKALEVAPVTIIHRKKRRKFFFMPASEEKMPHRPNTKRAALIEILSRPGGATFEECQAATGWTDYKITYENIYLLSSYLGYGLSEAPDGRIRLFSEVSENERMETEKSALRGGAVALADEAGGSGYGAEVEVELTDGEYRVKARKSGLFFIANIKRLEFIADAVGEKDLEGAIRRALRCFDRLVCAKLEGARAVLVGRNGKTEELET